MQEFVVVYLIDRNTDEVYYLKKDRPHMKWIHDKLVGWGGKLEKGESIKQAAIREIKEELGLDLDESELILQGEFIDGIGGKVYVMKYFLDERLPEGVVGGEGEAYYKSKDYHKQYPEEFPRGNLEFESILLFSDDRFNIDFSKNV